MGRLPLPWRGQRGQHAGQQASTPYSSGFPSMAGQEAACGGGPLQLRAQRAGWAALRCLHPSSVPILLPKLAISPEAAPVVAETAAFCPPPISPYAAPPDPLPSGDSALEPEQQAKENEESERMSGDRRKRPWPKPPIKKEQGCFSNFFSLSWLLSLFSIFEPFGHSCLLISIPPVATDIFLRCSALTKPLSMLILQDQALPYLQPSLKLLGLDWSLEEAEEKDATHAGCLPTATSMPVSSGTSLGGCQAPALPRETCFRRA